MKSKFFYWGLLLLLSGCHNLTNHSDSKGAPELSTDSIKDLSSFSAVLGGRIIDFGNSVITETGVVVDTIPSPTIERNYEKLLSAPGSQGEFATSMTKILPGKKWYFRTYAVNANGVGYGVENTFSSGSYQTIEKDVTLTKQTDVDAFGEQHYNCVKGYLIINGPVTDLSPLADLVIVSKGLQIKNTQLKNLQGLNKLEVTGNDFMHSMIIENNPLLESLDGLDRISTINGHFFVTDNPSLRSVNGFMKLQKLEAFTVVNNRKLAVMGGFGKLNRITFGLDIRKNDSLPDLYCFANLRETGALRIVENNALTSMYGLNRLKNIAQNLDIESNAGLTSLKGLDNLESVGTLSIVSNKSLESLTGLESLRHITIDSSYPYAMDISENVLLLNLHGLRSLINVSAPIKIENNKSLIDLCGLKTLFKSGCNSYFNVRGNGANPKWEQIIVDCPLQ